MRCIGGLRDAVECIPGLGVLYVYETAVRIGAWLDLAPTSVYIHAGVRDGARALGLDPSRPQIPRNEFPEEIRVIPADDIENLVCIYKSQLLALRSHPDQGAGVVHVSLSVDV